MATSVQQLRNNGSLVRGWETIQNIADLHVAVCCSALPRHMAVRQRVAVCRSLLQYVAVCCSVLHTAIRCSWVTRRALILDIWRIRVGDAVTEGERKKQS